MGSDGTDGGEVTRGTDGTGGPPLCDGTVLLREEALQDAPPLPGDLEDECFEVSPEEYPPNYYESCCYYRPACIEPPECAPSGRCLPRGDVADQLPAVGFGCSCDPEGYEDTPWIGPDGRCCYLVGSIWCI